MRDKGRRLLLELPTHFMMGVALGLSFALLLTLIKTFGVEELIAHSEAPSMTMFTFAGAFGLMFGVGATLTGFVFALEEDS